MAVHFKVFDKHLPDCQTNIARLAMFAQQLGWLHSPTPSAHAIQEDVLVLTNVSNNENFRHAAYRQYVLWQHGRLERGNRRIVPSCCAVAIPNRYLSPNRQYRGYLPVLCL